MSECVLFVPLLHAGCCYARYQNKLFLAWQDEIRSITVTRTADSYGVRNRRRILRISAIFSPITRRPYRTEHQSRNQYFQRNVGRTASVKMSMAALSRMFQMIKGSPVAVVGGTILISGSVIYAYRSVYRPFATRRERAESEAMANYIFQMEQSRRQTTDNS
uniref:Uncharacterized protein n=1 Tax=Anopheles funestus TaxID=62324 RepID=A0A4Y0BKM0_ANOFN